MTKRTTDDTREQLAPPAERDAARARWRETFELAGPASWSRDPEAHLSEEEFVGVILEDLVSPVALSVSLHLDHCESCASALIEHYERCAEFDRRESGER